MAHSTTKEILEQAVEAGDVVVVGHTKDGEPMYALTLYGLARLKSAEQLYG